MMLKQESLNNVIRFFMVMEESLGSYGETCWPTLTDDICIDWLDGDPIYDSEDDDIGMIPFTEDSLMRYLWRGLQCMRRDSFIKRHHKGMIDGAIFNDPYALKTFAKIMQWLCDSEDLIIYETKQIKVRCPECNGQEMIMKVNGDADDCPTCGRDGLILLDIPDVELFEMRKQEDPSL